MDDLEKALMRVVVESPVHGPILVAELERLRKLIAEPRLRRDRRATDQSPWRPGLGPC